MKYFVSTYYFDTATTRNNTVPWFVTPCSCHQGLGEACCFHLQSRTMQMETFVSTHLTTRRHSPDDSNLQYCVPVMFIIRATCPTQHHVLNLFTQKVYITMCVRGGARVRAYVSIAQLCSSVMVIHLRQKFTICPYLQM
jgi:hypothetical protein